MKKDKSILSQWNLIVSSNEKHLAAEKKCNKSIDIYTDSLIELLSKKWQEYFGPDKRFCLGYPLPGDWEGVKITIKNYLRHPNKAICIFPYYQCGSNYKVIYPYKNRWFILSFVEEQDESYEKHTELPEIDIKPQLFLDFLKEVSALSGIKFDHYQSPKRDIMETKETL
jgi:hypothetical protein